MVIHFVSWNRIGRFVHIITHISSYLIIVRCALSQGDVWDRLSCAHAHPNFSNKNAGHQWFLVPRPIQNHRIHQGFPSDKGHPLGTPWGTLGAPLGAPHESVTCGALGPPHGDQVPPRLRGRWAASKTRAPVLASSAPTWKLGNYGVNNGWW